MSIIIIIAIVVIIITTVLLVMMKKKTPQTTTSTSTTTPTSKKSNKTKTSVMLTGICDVGKTSLFLCMKNDNETETCTSMTENIGTCINEKNGEEIEIVDIPGHGKVRNSFKKYIETTKCVIFVVSAVDIKKTIKDDANFLHNIIVANARNVPILVVSNKNDLSMPEAVDVIQKMLEKELNKLRIRIAKPGEVISDDEKCMYGDANDDFHFDQLEYDVNFVEASVKDNDIDALWNYLSSLNQNELKTKKNN